MGKKNEQAIAFEVGQRVLATMGKEQLPGTVDAVTKQGWIVVHLDNPPEDVAVKDGRVSLRAKVLKPEPEKKAPAAGSFLAQVDAMAHRATVEATLEAANEEAEEKEEHPMAKALRQARQHYVKAKLPDGGSTAHCGDKIAKLLQGFEPLEVSRIADRVLQQHDGFHANKYGHLNNGQIRMNSGNKIRGYWTKIVADGNLDEATRVGRILGLLDEDETAEVLGMVAPAAADESEQAPQ